MDLARYWFFPIDYIYCSLLGVALRTKRFNKRGLGRRNPWKSREVEMEQRKEGDEVNLQGVFQLNLLDYESPWLQIASRKLLIQFLHSQMLHDNDSDAHYSNAWLQESLLKTPKGWSSKPRSHNPLHTFNGFGKCYKTSRAAGGRNARHREVLQRSVETLYGAANPNWVSIEIGEVHPNTW